MRSPYLIGLEVRRRMADRLKLPDKFELPVAPLAQSGIVFGANPIRPFIKNLEPRDLVHGGFPMPEVKMHPMTPRFTGRLPTIGGVITDRGTQLPGEVTKVVSRA